jgi:alanyl-tRNA synthetase
VVLVGSTDGGKVNLVCGVTADLTGRIAAGTLVGRVSALVGGKGGGRPDMAQGGGTLMGNFAEAMQQVPQIVEKLVQE